MSNPVATSNPRIILVLGDGAIRAGFVAGAIGRLVEAIPELLSKIDLVYGSSASAGNAIYLTAFDDDHPGERMWTHLLADQKFIRKSSIRNDEPIYDIEYLVEGIFRGKTPLPEHNCGIPDRVGVVFPVIELGTSRVHYFANAIARSMIETVRPGVLDPMEGHDIYRLIGAASAAPFVFDRPFMIDGVGMIDGAALAPSIDDIVLSSDNNRYIYIFCRKPPTLGTFAKYMLSTLAFIAFVLPFRKVRLPIRNYFQYAIKPRYVRRAFRGAFDNQLRARAAVIFPDSDLGDIDDNTEENLLRNYKYGEAAADAMVVEVRRLISA
jgi:hypothetical protein